MNDLTSFASEVVNDVSENAEVGVAGVQRERCSASGVR